MRFLSRYVKSGEIDVSYLLLENRTKGLSFLKLKNKMGWKASPTNIVILIKKKIYIKFI